jgi:hypothetical protein
LRVACCRIGGCATEVGGASRWRGEGTEERGLFPRHALTWHGEDSIHRLARWEKRENVQRQLHCSYETRHLRTYIYQGLTFTKDLHLPRTYIYQGLTFTNDKDRLRWSQLVLRDFGSEYSAVRSTPRWPLVVHTTTGARPCTPCNSTRPMHGDQWTLAAAGGCVGGGTIPDVEASTHVVHTHSTCLPAQVTLVRLAAWQALRFGRCGIRTAAAACNQVGTVQELVANPVEEWNGSRWRMPWSRASGSADPGKSPRVPARWC